MERMWKGFAGQAVRRMFLCLAAVLVLMQASLSFAQGYTYGAGYETEAFDVKVTVSEDHVCHVEETITVNFQSEKHGIFRYIPYEPGIYTIKHVRIADDSYDVESQYENGINQKIIRIGDEDKTLKGRHTYLISYDIVAYRDRDEVLDYFSLDVLPTEWETDIQKSHITVQMPKEIDPEKLQVFSGSYGLDENYLGIDADYDNASNTITISAENLYQGAGISLYTELPEGYWEEAASRDWLLYPLLVILAGVPVLCFVLWLIFGRDKKLIRTVEFYPPEDLTPAEIGYIIDGSVDTKDMVSMLTYFAEKGWLSIAEYEKDKFELKRLKNIDAKEKRFAKTLFAGLFEEGDVVSLNELPKEFGEVFQLSKSQLKDFYSGKKALVTGASRVCRAVSLLLVFLLPMISVGMAAAASFNYLYAVFLVLVFFLTVVGGAGMLITFDRRATYSAVKKTVFTVIAGLLMTAGFALAALVCFAAMDWPWVSAALLTLVSPIVSFIFAVLMEARTELSLKLQGQILGFRDFIETAELEKLKLLADEDPQYFYHIMPYAYVMGLSDKWIKKFEKIPTVPPFWYTGSGTDYTFSVLWYSHMFRSCSGSFVNQTIRAVAANSADTGGGGGGFGGGGFSGGGFGGGGGGAW